MESIQELLKKLCKCIVKSDDGLNYITISKQETPTPPTPPAPAKPDLDTFDPNVPFCIENVGDVKASVQYNTKNNNIRISRDYVTWNDYNSSDDPITLYPAERLYIKSDYVKDTGSSSRFIFNGVGAQLRARGNIASLIYGTNDAYVTKYTSTEEYCYYRMFFSCISLTQAPDLPATILASDCYNTMFYNCTSLTQAPELPATTLVTRCYDSIFQNCKKINYVKCLATDISASNCTNIWLLGVSSTGDFYTPASTNWTSGDNGIPSGWTRHDIT